MKRLSLALLCLLFLAFRSWAGPPKRNRSFQFLDFGRCGRQADHRIVAPIYGGTRLEIRLKGDRRGGGLSTEEGLDVAEALDGVNRRLSTVLEPPAALTVELDRGKGLDRYQWEAGRIVGALHCADEGTRADLAPLLREYGRAYFLHNLRLRHGEGDLEGKGRLERLDPYGCCFGELLAEVFHPSAKPSEPPAALRDFEGVQAGTGKAVMGSELGGVLGSVMGGSAASAGAARVAAAAFQALAEEAGRALEGDGTKKAEPRGREIVRRIHQYLRLQ